MTQPTVHELRLLAQEITADTENDLCITRVEELLLKKDGIKAAQYYLLGFLSAYIQDEDVPEAKVRAYLTVLDLPDEEIHRYARRNS